MNLLKTTLCLSGLALASFSHASALYDISVSSGSVCVIDDNNLQCWDYSGADITPSVTNATEVAGNYYGACQIADNTLNCLQSGFDLPSLTNPRSLNAGAYNVCAIGDEGLGCWGYSAVDTAPTLVNPTQVAIGGHTCAIDDSGLQCWGDNSNGQTAVPALTNVRMVTAGGRHTCAIDDAGLQCWGDDSANQVSDAPTNIKDPVMMASTNNTTCLLDANGLTCWGGDNGVADVPDLNMPYAVDTGERYACAITSDGVVCWGNSSTPANPQNLPVFSDADGDGIDNLSDAFPGNPAASVDADQDGIPDAWNESCDETCQNSSGLTLDTNIEVADTKKDDSGGSLPLPLVALSFIALLFSRRVRQPD